MDSASVQTYGDPSATAAARTEQEDETALDAMHRLWRDEGLPITLEPEDVGWARIFYGLDPDGYEVMFEQFTN